MDLARFVVDAVVTEGRSAREAARAHGVSKSWVCELVARYRAEGYEALGPRSRRPLSVPSRTSDELENQIVLLRKRLEGDGLDAGPRQSITTWRNNSRSCPRSTIWRVLKRRGFVVPEPHKRPG